MTAENENIKNSHSFSETTRKVFLSTTILKSPPSGLFSPPFLTVKGLYPPPIQLLISTTTTYLVRSLSVPVKLITEKEMPFSTIQGRPPMKVSASAPTFKKPNLIDKLITNMNPKHGSSSTTTTVRKAPRSSTFTRTASAAPVQIKTSTSIKLIHKEVKVQEEDEEDIPVTKPISLTEKRKRQAKRADQVKIWKVREEREAREARSLIRRNLMTGVTKKKLVSPPLNEISKRQKKKKKRVKFDFDKNKIIQIPNDEL